MRLRASFAAAALLAGIATTATAPAASAYCDEKYWPLCVNDCGRWDPNSGVKGLIESLKPKVCPDSAARP